MTRKLRQDVLKAIPRNWLDPLLTGPSAVIGQPPYTGHDIERLLSAVKKRLAELVATQVSPPTPEVCKTCDGRRWVMRTYVRNNVPGGGAGGMWNEPCPDCSSPPPEPGDKR